MPRQKRPYVPKIKGCYECSQRRIHCDRTQPCCGKCASRGIPCSGLGVRYRFRDGVTSGSKVVWQQEKSPHCSQQPRHLPQDGLSSLVGGDSSKGQFNWSNSVTTDPTELNALTGLGSYLPESIQPTDFC
ncbi:hypothetical protein BDV28DRAFT_23658 [Aspergillus coremiiformis]|uniref:Zn(2)-C6 fungal-type domain-containing protein n=1 Tax=Aspergillus coremiiformis TaxID=138285 RepID=A0A5N6Z5C6_9EURO|nr:hypothetical protein BDV28DRAFT_23658 [Aspergillus coremiiformis]